MEVIYPDQMKNANNFRFEFTNTYRNQSVDLNNINGDVILDVDGTFWKKNSFDKDILVSIIGGINKFEFSKTNSSAVPFYMTIAQKRSLYKLIYFAVNPGNISKNISSSNYILENMMFSLYRNIKG